MLPAAQCALQQQAWGLSCLLARPALRLGCPGCPLSVLLIGRSCDGRDGWASSSLRVLCGWLAVQNHLRDMTAAMPTSPWLVAGYHAACPCRGCTAAAVRGLSVILREGAFRPITLQYSKGPGRARGAAEIIPSPLTTTTPCRTGVCTCTGSGTGTDRAQASISENKTNCRARRRDH